MPQFTVEDELVAQVWRLAKPRPFENLSFNTALRRVLQGDLVQSKKDKKLDHLEDLYAEAMAASLAGLKKAASPNPMEWTATVPELRSRKDLNTWKAICKVLKIDTAGDSASRRLKNWVKVNRSTWPPVPDTD